MVLYTFNFTKKELNKKISDLIFLVDFALEKFKNSNPANKSELTLWFKDITNFCKKVSEIILNDTNLKVTYYARDVYESIDFKISQVKNYIRLLGD